MVWMSGKNTDLSRKLFIERHDQTVEADIQLKPFFDPKGIRILAEKMTSGMDTIESEYTQESDQNIKNTFTIDTQLTRHK